MVKKNSEGSIARKWVIIFFAFAVLSGIPIWWKITETYRAPLPNLDVTKLNSWNPWRYHFKINILECNQKNRDSLDKSVVEFFKNYQPQVKRNLEVSPPQIEYEISQSCVEKTFEQMENHALETELLQLIQHQPSDKFQFTIFIIPSSNTKSIISQFSFAWTLTDSNRVKSELGTIVGSLLPTETDDELPFGVRPFPSYTVSFTLLNGRPTKDHLFSWNFERFYDHSGFFARFFKRLQTVADYKIDSQVSHFAELAKTPLKLKDSKTNSTFWAVPETDLAQYFVPANWRLDTPNNSTEPVINLIVYIPPAEISPLYIVSKDSKKIIETNGFVLPQWGGVVIFNPETSSGALTDKDLHNVGQILLSQMRQVITGAHFDSNLMTVASHGGGVSDWELETLKRRHLHYFMHNAVNSLESLQKLVSDITNIVVLDSIQQLFEKAVHGILVAKQSLQIDEALQSAKNSYLASESAFFDAKMLGLLYFPDEHKYAIYALPFFPIIYQLLSGIYKEFKHQQKAT